MKIRLRAFIMIIFVFAGVGLYLNQSTEICAEITEVIQTAAAIKNTGYELEKETDSVMTIILDPGHGGYDEGASAFGLYEKDITLQLALAVGEILTTYDIEVVYTRDDDSALAENEKQDLRTRVSMANNLGASYYISFHLNASDMIESCYGFEIWTDLNQAESTSLSQHILDQLDALQYSLNRGLKDGMEAPLYVIANTTMPSILIEYGFLDHEGDASYLADAQHIQQLAQATADGILIQLGLIDAS